ncbi:jg12332 [Pararge aegeria aegeria]|uniref:Jg12332 protein n=1 Tax=Pararge aegeria aegeria TaxID=348720 RepID=A0A8S4R9P9_9NEOP|nr:jg12332 [Pararge aegeria aegeria]
MHYRAAASSAEQAKRRKYENLDSSFIFVPFGVETLGPLGPEARALFKELSKRVIESTGDPRAGSYLGQRISLAIQRGNAASILGTVPRCGGFEDVLDFI